MSRVAFGLRLLRKPRAWPVPERAAGARRSTGRRTPTGLSTTHSCCVMASLRPLSSRNGGRIRGEAPLGGKRMRLTLADALERAAARRPATEAVRIDDEPPVTY